jgi:FMN phosphatase YigB (HAD superfamily)
VQTPEVVTFDYWNTLVWEEPGELFKARLRELKSAFMSHGAVVSDLALEHAHAASFELFESSSLAGQQFVVAHAVKVILDELGLSGLSPGRVADAFTIGGDQADLHLTPGVGECLSELKAYGIKLGIVCDVGLTPSPVLRRQLNRFGLLGAFDAWAFSDEVGIYKPAPVMFRQVLAALGCRSAERAVHVGDRRRTDVAGALAVGMRSVRYNAIFDDLDETLPDADFVVSDLRELASLLLGRAPDSGAMSPRVE